MHTSIYKGGRLGDHTWAFMAALHRETSAPSCVLGPRAVHIMLLGTMRSMRSLHYMHCITLHTTCNEAALWRSIRHICLIAKLASL